MDNVATGKLQLVGSGEDPRKLNLVGEERFVRLLQVSSGAFDGRLHHHAQVKTENTISERGLTMKPASSWRNER